MRVIKLLGSVAVLLAWLLCSVVCSAQTVPVNAVPFVSEVLPPSLPATATAPGNGNFTLTILGANFTSNAVVNLTAFGSYTIHPVSTIVNAAGSQITAQFSNATLSPSTLALTVTNPAGAQPTTSNAFFLPNAPAESSVVLNQNTTSFLAGYPMGIVAAFLGGNQNLDFVVVSQTSDTVSIQSSNGNGPFITGPSYATGNQPWGIAAADFFGTGQLGLAITNSLDNTITILLPNGGGTFRPGILITLPGVFPTQIVAADFNGDGKIDLAVLNTCGTGSGGCFPQAAPQGPGTVTILLGDGFGGFTASPAVITTGNIPYAMVAADFNGDGIIDLAVANSGSNTVTLLMGNGDGTFTPATNSAATGNGPSGVAVGDFNGDGQLDLAVTNSADNAVSILLNQNCSSLAAAACTFAATATAPAVGGAPSAIATGDLNADGNLDLVVTNASGNSVTVLLGDGTGNFTALLPQQGTPNFATGASPQGVLLGDFNQAGRLDIVTSNASGSYTYMRQAAVPQVTLSSSNLSPFYGQLVSYTANVQPTSAQPTPTGTVTFFDGSTALGTVSISGYQAYWQFGGLGAGTHQVNAVYSGDSNFVPATSNVVTETVAKAQTSTTLSANVTTVPYGQPFTLTATIAVSGINPTTGTIKFFDSTTSTDLGDVSPVNNQAQVTLSNLAGGTHVVVATYSGDNNFSGSSSANLTETIIPATTTTTVSASPSPATLGQTVTLTAAVQPGTGNTATGGVLFFDNGAPLGAGTLSNNTAHYSTNALSVGTHAITAQYTGDANFASSTSTASPASVTPGLVSINLMPNLTNPIYGQPATITATVEGAPYAAIPTGTMTFFDGSTPLGIATLSNGSVTFSLPVLSEGRYTISAKYGGDSNYQAATSYAFQEFVLQATTTTTLSSSANPASYGQPVTLTAALQLPYGGKATGSVTFSDSGILIGTAWPTGNSAVLVTSSLALGSHSITAAYAGDGNTSSSLSAPVTETINPAATTTTLTSSVSSSVYGQTVSFTPTVKPAFGNLPFGVIYYYDGTTLLGASNPITGPGQLTISTLTAGTHSITAQFTTTNGNFTGSASTALTETVSQAPTTTTIYLFTNGASYGQSVQLQVSVSETYPYSSSTGSVTLYDNGTPIRTAAMQGNGVNLAVSGLTAGTHSLTASFSGDSNLLASTSTAYTQTIVPEPTQTSVAPSSNSLSYGQPVTLSVTVKPSNGTTATGTITFLDGTTAIGTVALASNAAQFTVSNVTPGTHSYSAQYSGDANTASSVSTSAQVTEAGPPTATILTANPNPAVLNQSVAFTATIQHTTSGTPGGTVAIYSGTTLLGTSTVINGSAQFTASSGFPVSTQSITATYSGDSNFSGSTSTVLSEVVNPGPTTTTVSASPNPSILNANVTFTVTVNAFPITNGLATGLVTLFDGTTSLGSTSLPSGQNYGVFTLSTLTPGTHSISAQYAGSASLAPSASSALSQIVNLPATTTALSSSANPAGYGQAVTLVASVQPPGSGTATGTVTFYNGAASLGTSTVSNNSAQLSLSSLPVGANSLTAKYSGDTNYAGSASGTLSETINPSTTTTTVSSSANPATMGQQVTFTASVTPAFGTSPTGTITFYDGSTSIGAVAVSSGAAQVTVTGLSAGSHSITAVYSGDANFSGSTSGALGETVNAAASSTALTSSSATATVGQTIAFTATVQPSVGSTASGTVTFLDGTTAIGAVALASNSAQLSISTLTLGTHSITATYGGNGNLAASSSAGVVETITQASTTMTIASGLNPATFGQAVQFSGTVVTPSGGAATGTVTFYDGSTSVGTATVTNNGSQHNSVTLYYSGFTGGTHTITASYSGDANYAASTSAPLTETVTPASSTVAIASGLNPATFGQSVTFTATVQPSLSADFAGGTVTFYDAATALGTVSLSSEVVQLSLSSLAAGSHSITAKYSGDGNFAGTTSSVLTETINQGSTTTTVASSANPSTFGQAVTFSASVQPIFGASVTGTVTFFDGSTALGTAAVSNNSAQFTIATLVHSGHSITASYGGNASLTGSSSSALTQTVNQAPTTTAISSSANPATFGQAVTITATVQPALGGTVIGTVTFFDGSVQIGTSSVSGNMAQVIAAGGVLAEGNHSLAAKYNGDGNFLGSTSAVLPETVNAAPTTTSLTSSANPKIVGSSVTFTATVSSTASGTQSGKIMFYVDGSSTAAATVTLSGGAASYSTASLAVGTHTIVATFASTNLNFAGSSSTTVSQQISDFSVSSSPTSLTVARSHSGSTTLTVSPLSGFTGNVALSCPGAPSKVTCSISPSQVTLNGTSAAATVTITVASGASTGKHTLTFQGVSGGVTHKVSFTLTVD